MSVRTNIFGPYPEPSYLGLNVSCRDRVITSAATDDEKFGLIYQLEYKPAPFGDKRGVHSALSKSGSNLFELQAI